MIRRIALAAVSVLALVAIVIALSFISPAKRPDSPVIALPQTSRVTCVPSGELRAVSDASLSLASLGGEPGDGLDSPVAQKIEAPTVVRAESAVAAGVSVSTGGRGWVPCETPTSSGVVLVQDPSRSELTLVNSDSTEAVVDLTLLGPDGEIEAVGARGIAIAPGVARRIALSVLAEEAGGEPIAVAFTSTPGRVTVQANAVEGSSQQRFATASSLDTTHLITGIPHGSSKQRLLVTNPGTDRITVDVQAMSESGTYAPTSADELTVAARSTVAVDLGSDLGGEATALKVSSSGPLGAAVVLDEQDGPAVTLGEARSSTVLASPADEKWTLQVTNPGVDPVEATVTGAEDSKLIVRPGMTVTVPAAADASQVRVEASGPLVGAVTSQESKGLVVAPLSPVGITQVPGRPANYAPVLR